MWGRAVLLGVVASWLTCTGCGGSRPIALSALRDDRSAVFFVTDRWVAMASNDPNGAMMVVNPPYLDGDRVVLSGAATSSGAAATRMYCFDVGALSPAEGWRSRVVWLEADGTLSPVDTVPGDEAARVVPLCER